MMTMAWSKSQGAVIFAILEEDVAAIAVAPHRPDDRYRLL